MGKKLRLDKYLADMKVGSRQEVKKQIKKGSVTVDGQTIKTPEQKVEPGKETIAVDGVEIGYVEREYWMLNKPAGWVSATEDKQFPTVVELIRDQSRRDLFPVGRLDKDTEGLLLLTNDGKLAHELLSPKKHVDKTYYARVSGRVEEKDKASFQNGMDIGDEKRTLPAKLEILNRSEEESEIMVTIQEGRFHQVKRMFEAVGKKVLYLKRISMGPLSLDESLSPGMARKLTDDEIRKLNSPTG